ncbi:hypothetical protein Bbelb_184140 [Branchiostoma belcheri]|nr:hypothetical protein Bbelb_184140 [Branchiostoma belcheri]
MFSFLLINAVFLLQIVARLFGVLKRDTDVSPDDMFGILVQFSLLLFRLVVRIVGSVRKAVNVRFVRSEKCGSAVPPPPVVREPSAPAQESGTSVRKKTSCSNEACATVKKKSRRSDLNGPTDPANTPPKTKPAEPDKPSASVRAPGTAKGKPKATFGGMKAGFLLQSPKKKPRTKTETAAKADTPKAVKAPPDQKLKNTSTASAGQKHPNAEAGHPKVNPSQPRQKKEDPPQTPSAGEKSGQKKEDPQTPSAGEKSGQKKPQSPRRPTSESGQTPRQSSSSEVKHAFFITPETR